MREKEKMAMVKEALSRAGRFARLGAVAAGLAAPVGATLAGAALAEGTFVVQLVSVKSEARAKNAWDTLRDRHGELLGDMDFMVQRVDLGDRGIFFRLQTGPFPNRTTAVDMCGQLQAAKLECIVKER